MLNNNNKNKFKPGGLGKGLGALLGDKNMYDEKKAEVEEKIENLKGSSSLEEISLDLIEANPDQPRPSRIYIRMGIITHIIFYSPTIRTIHINQY